MLSPPLQHTMSEFLTPDNIVRLRRAASLFDIYMTDDGGNTVHFHVLDNKAGETLTSPEISPCRGWP